MLKKVLSVALVGLSFFTVGCGSDKSATDGEKAPAQVEVQKNDDKSAQGEKSMKEILAENEKLLKEMQPKKDAIDKNTAAALPNAKNISATVSSRDVFDISFDIDVPGADITQARIAAVNAIQTALSANAEYTISMVSVVVTSQNAPGCIVAYSDGSYVSVIDGKREPFTP